jgi:formylglycine-generating enzyme required for sulfatase activity
MMILKKVMILAALAVTLMVAGCSSSLHDTRTRPADGMVMVFVPEGSFMMGSDDGYSDEVPQHGVLLDSFWIDQTEVTNAMYQACVSDGLCTASTHADDSNFNNDNQPVVGVDWNDAKAYCEWAGAQLPTEAQWEYAARGPDGNIYPWGNDGPNSDLANYGGNVGDTSLVGSYPDGASWVGALDMAGNVWEWVADWYDADYYQTLDTPALNPLGPASGALRVLRGGAGGSFEDDVRTAARNRVGPGDHHNSVGFRCASTAS